MKRLGGTALDRDGTGSTNLTLDFITAFTLVNGVLPNLAPIDSARNPGTAPRTDNS